MSNPDEQQTVISVPVPVTITHESHLVVVTKLLSWLCATLLATSVLVALISVTNERNNLQTQIEAQSLELACRSEAAGNVNEANANLNLVTAEQNRIIGEIVASSGTSPDLEPLIVELNTANDEIIEAAELAFVAVEAQQKALTSCSHRD